MQSIPVNSAAVQSENTFGARRNLGIPQRRHGSAVVRDIPHDHLRASICPGCPQRSARSFADFGLPRLSAAFRRIICGLRSVPVVRGVLHNHSRISVCPDYPQRSAQSFANSGLPRLSAALRRPENDTTARIIPFSAQEVRNTCDPRRAMTDCCPHSRKTPSSPRLFSKSKKRIQKSS